MSNIPTKNLIHSLRNYPGFETSELFILAAGRLENQAENIQRMQRTLDMMKLTFPSEYQFCLNVINTQYGTASAPENVAEEMLI